MVAILFAISGIAAVAGVGAILVGFPNYEFGLGNTLILGGCIAIVGAMIVFGLAATVRELRRVGRLLERTARPPRPVDADGAGRPAGRAGAAPRPQPMSPGRRPPDQRLGPIPSADRPPMDFDPLRANGLSSGREASEPSVVDEVETVPLSPAGLGRSAPTPPPMNPLQEAQFERRPEPPPAPSIRPQPSARPLEPARQTRNIFDPNWSRAGAGRSEPERAPMERAAPPNPRSRWRAHRSSNHLAVSQRRRSRCRSRSLSPA